LLLYLPCWWHTRCSSWPVSSHGCHPTFYRSLGCRTPV
jgi:hypothetical protein